MAAAIGLALGLGAASVQAHTDDPCPHNKADHPHCTGSGGGAGGGSSGKGIDLEVGIVSDDALEDDDRGDYIHNQDGVKAGTGGETQPNRPGIVVNLRGNGPNPREVTIDVACSNPDVDPGPGVLQIGDCTNLPGGVLCPGQLRLY